MAKKWLENNGSNRRMRHTFVQYIIDEIKQGKWQLTHQGVAISKDGMLLDGQHRLQAIASLGVTLEMVVALDVPFDSVLGFQVDNGEKRTIADIMHESPQYVAMLNAILSISITTPGRSHRYTTAERQAVNTALGDNLKVFLGHCTTHRRTTSSANWKVPVFIHWMLQGDEVLEQYKAIVLLKQQDMWPRVDAFHKQLIRDDRVMKGDKISQACRVWTAFDPTKRNIERVVFNGTEVPLAEMRKALGILGLGSELTKLEGVSVRGKTTKK